MIHLFPVGRVITYIAVGYAVFPLVFLYFTWPADNSKTVYSAAGTALTGAGALSAILYFSFNYGWRWVWRLCPKLNTAVYPDLNGQWDMRIEWNRRGMNGVKTATAIIRQDFLKISMEVHSEDSDSETYLAQPKREPESGRPMLYYVYKVTPKQIAGAVHPSYNGTARLKFSSADQVGLQGNYFTDAESQGYFELTRRSS